MNRIIALTLLLTLSTTLIAPSAAAGIGPCDMVEAKSSADDYDPDQTIKQEDQGTRTGVIISVSEGTAFRVTATTTCTVAMVECIVGKVTAPDPRVPIIGHVEVSHKLFELVGLDDEYDQLTQEPEDDPLSEIRKCIG